MKIMNWKTPLKLNWRLQLMFSKEIWQTMLTKAKDKLVNNTTPEIAINNSKSTQVYQNMKINLHILLEVIVISTIRNGKKSKFIHLKVSWKECVIILMLFIRLLMTQMIPKWCRKRRKENKRMKMIKLLSGK